MKPPPRRWTRRAREGENARAFLTGFDGMLQADGDTGGNRLAKPSRKGGAN